MNQSLLNVQNLKNNFELYLNKTLPISIKLVISLKKIYVPEMILPPLHSKPITTVVLMESMI